jgi:hypothetical protein
MNKIFSQRQIHYSLRPFLSLLPDDSTNSNSTQLWWTNQEFSSVDIIPLWFSMLIYHLGDEKQARWWPQFRDIISSHRHAHHHHRGFTNIWNTSVVVCFNTFFWRSRLHLMYSVYHLKCNPTTVTYWGIKWNQKQVHRRALNSFKLHITWVKIAHVTRPLFTPVAKKLGRCKHRVFTSRTCVHSGTLLRIEIVCCFSQSM